MTCPNGPNADSAETERHELRYKANERAWQFVNGPCQTNDLGDLVSPARHPWSQEGFLGFNTDKAFADCVVSAKWRYIYPGGGRLQLIVRAMDSRRFYAIRPNTLMHLPGISDDLYLMVSIWKGGADGYQRMLAYRSKVGLYHRTKDPDKWRDIRVVCVGPEIIVYFDGNFVCAARDDEYPAGCVGVEAAGQVAWKDIVVEGQPVDPKPAWSMVEAETPRQLTFVSLPDTVNGLAGEAMVLPDDEIMFNYGPCLNKNNWWMTRSRDYGLTWTEPVSGREGICHVRSLDEFWCFTQEQKAVWTDEGENFDELIPENFCLVMSRSKDGGRTWSGSEELNCPFPAGQVYSPIQGKTGSVLCPNSPPSARELSDGSLGLTAYWRNTTDGHYTSDQVQFLRTTDGGRTWSLNPVDSGEWSRNESSWVELDNGELLCAMRSNYEHCLGLSRSRDKGQTWSRVQPAIPFFGASAPALIHTSNNVLVLTERVWGVHTSVDGGQTWNLPTHIGAYCGSGTAAGLLEMSDGRMLIIGSDNISIIKGQFITVDKDGVVHPAPPGPPE